MMEKVGVSNEDLKAELQGRLKELKDKIGTEEFIKEASAQDLCAAWAEVREIESKIQSLEQ